MLRAHEADPPSQAAADPSAGAYLDLLGREQQFQQGQDQAFDETEFTTAAGHTTPGWTMPWARPRRDPNMGTMSLLAQGLRDAGTPRVRFPNPTKSRIF